MIPPAPQYFSMYFLKTRNSLSLVLPQYSDQTEELDVETTIWSPGLIEISVVSVGSCTTKGHTLHPVPLIQNASGVFLVFHHLDSFPQHRLFFRRLCSWVCLMLFHGLDLGRASQQETQKWCWHFLRASHQDECHRSGSGHWPVG